MASASEAFEEVAVDASGEAITIDAGVEAVSGEATTRDLAAAAAAAAASKIGGGVSGTSGGEGNESGSSLTVFVVIGVFIILVAYWLWNRSKSVATTASEIASGTVVQNAKNGVVLVGCSGAGKTILFHRLVSPPGTPSPQTLPSMVPAYGELALSTKPDDSKSNGAKNKQLSIVDFPGHERLWPSLMQQLVGAKGVVFVVDATDTKAIKKSALLLFELLSSPVALKNKSAPLLIYCNKADMGQKAKESGRIIKMMQLEIESMRKSSSSMGAADLDGMSADEAKVPVGVADKKFDFTDPDAFPCGPVSVATGSSIATHPGDIGNVLAFLDKC